MGATTSREWFRCNQTRNWLGRMRCPGELSDGGVFVEWYQMEYGKYIRSLAELRRVLNMDVLQMDFEDFERGRVGR